MLQHGQAAVLNCSPIWRAILMRKSFKTLSEIKAQVHFQKETWKREAMAVSTGKGTLLSCDMVKHESRVTSCKLLVTS